jgi:hypothetical protein
MVGKPTEPIPFAFLFNCHLLLSTRGRIDHARASHTHTRSGCWHGIIVPFFAYPWEYS